MKEAKDIGRKIKRLLVKNDKDVYWLAEFLGKSYSTANRYVDGVTMIDIVQLQQIAGWFGVPVSWFFDEARVLNVHLVVRRGHTELFRVRLESDVTVSIEKE